jgi:hypothetical protein
MVYLSSININTSKTMGCGCKNKGSNQKTTNSTVTQPMSKTTNESVKDAIKRTVEKYYKKS